MLPDILAWIFGIGAVISLFSSYQQTERKKLIKFKLSADVFWVGHYICLAAYSGGIANFAGILREIVFLYREDKKWASSVIWPILFVVIGWGLGFRTFKSPINILPIVASTFATLAFWLKNPKFTKVISAPASAFFLIYDIVIGSYVGAANEVMVLSSILISFMKGHQKKEVK